MVRLGILGGTFDPPHLGHLILAEFTLDALGLERVLFVPAAEPPHKDDDHITPIEHRLAMVEAAIGDNPKFVLSRADIDRPGPHYTVDLLEVLHREYQDAELYFIVGGDSLHDFISWRDPAGIIARARLAVMRRPGGMVDLSDLSVRLPGIATRVAVVSAPAIGISATDIRDRIKKGLTIRYLAPDPVIAYIVARGLYIS